MALPGTCDLTSSVRSFVSWSVITPHSKHITSLDYGITVLPGVLYITFIVKTVSRINFLYNQERTSISQIVFKDYLPIVHQCLELQNG